MKTKNLTLFIFILLSSTMNAQHLELTNPYHTTPQKAKDIFIGIAGGLKYHINKNEVTKYQKGYDNSPSIALSLGVNPFNKREHTIGLELLAYKYAESKDKFIENVFGLNLFYKRKFFTGDNIFVFPQLTVTALSNDPALMLSTSIDLGFGYIYDELEFSVKHSYRINIFNLEKTPNILLFGVALRI